MQHSKITIVEEGERFDEGWRGSLHRHFDYEHEGEL
jgi:hypothetical protein